MNMAIEQASSGPLSMAGKVRQPTGDTVRAPPSELARIVRSGRGRLWRRLMRHRSALLGLSLVSLLAALALFAPFVSGYDYADQDLSNMLQPPSLGHLLGTDELGRDIWSRIAHGARISLTFSALTVLVSTAIGTVVGLFTGYYGGWLDEVVMRFTDILLAFPGVLLAVTVVSVLGTGLQYVLLAIAIYITPGFVRVARSAVLAVKERQFVEAARAVGAGDRRILARHILPNILSPILVQSTLRTGSVILLISGLSFLGMGPKPPTPEWGLMLSTAKDYLRIAPHVSLVPGAAIMLAVLGFNLLGDALRDVLDPRQMIQ
jgi:peptide/nickel transport system permease protein